MSATRFPAACWRLKNGGERRALLARRTKCGSSALGQQTGPQLRTGLDCSSASTPDSVYGLVTLTQK